MTGLSIKRGMLAAVMALGFFVASQTSQAIVVGPLAGDSEVSIIGYNAGPINYLLGPTEVAWSASGSYWLKVLSPAGDATRPTLVPGTPGADLVIVEHLTVGGDTPWYDWHEVIVTNGFSFVDATVYAYGTTDVVDGLSVQMTKGTNDSYHFNNLDLFFSPLAPGTTITIVKTIRWEGINWEGSSYFGSDFIQIRQFPTVIPEPATLGLLAVGGGMFGLLRRRRKS